MWYSLWSALGWFPCYLHGFYCRRLFKFDFLAWCTEFLQEIPLVHVKSLLWILWKGNKGIILDAIQIGVQKSSFLSWCCLHNGCDSAYIELSLKLSCICRSFLFLVAEVLSAFVKMSSVCRLSSFLNFSYVVLCRSAG